MSEPGPPARADMRRAVGSLVVAAVTLAGVVVVGLLVGMFAAPVALFSVFAGVLGPGDGNRIAHDNVERSVAARVDRLGYWYEQTDAETVAAERLSGTFGAAEFTPIGWSGRVALGQAATVDVFVRSRVDARAPATFGERGTTAGSAAACYRFTFPSTDFVGADRIECPPGLAAATLPTPTPTVPPHLPDDAREVIADILADPSEGKAEQSLRSAFPATVFTVELVTTGAGERVVAVGAPASNDCILIVERDDGTLDEPGFDPVWILPGETGCATSLYTDPPL